MAGKWQKLFQKKNDFEDELIETGDRVTKWTYGFIRKDRYWPSMRPRPEVSLTSASLTHGTFVEECEQTAILTSSWVHYFDSGQV